MTTINNIDLLNLVFVEGDFSKSSDFGDVIYDNEGSFFGDKFACFTEAHNEDTEVFVEFEQEIRGYFDDCPGDYWTEGSCSTVVTCDEIYIYKVKIDFVEVEITKELESVLKSLIRKQIDEKC
jgi:hypothetical protein